MNFVHRHCFIESSKTGNYHNDHSKSFLGWYAQCEYNTKYGIFSVIKFYLFKIGKSYDENRFSLSMEIYVQSGNYPE